jgi:hypothetical protein
LTREEALAAILKLAHSLDGDEDAQASRLLERIAGSDEPELLRQALAEVGAKALLRQVRG